MIPRLTITTFADADAIRSALTDAVSWCVSRRISALTDEEIKAADDKVKHFQELLDLTNAEIQRLTQQPAAPNVIASNGDITFVNDESLTADWCPSTGHFIDCHVDCMDRTGTPADVHYRA